ncbi:hypothetical protein A3A66_01770 [Microgenomates group bacterium RIFCSPLOWO2_01_FULL_46_13]|nr:MAG: hypothetical protein A3A66_01770 [Microgenomates group bacterium RIFCSPLOWO2_01_FULL_46_13]
MKLITKPITREQLKAMAQKSFGNLVKAVVDVEKRIMIVDGDLHADEEAYLLERGSKQGDLWGINLYPELTDEDFIEFDSLINVRPNQGNVSRGVDNPVIARKIRQIVTELVK